VVLCRFPRVDARLRLVCCGRLCDDVCFGYDSRGEVPRGALDSEDGSVYCVSFVAGTYKPDSVEQRLFTDKKRIRGRR